MTRLELKLPPALLFGLAALAIWLWADGTPSGSGQRMVALGCVVLAGGLGGAAIRAFRRAATSTHPVHPHKATTLVTDGVFAYSRNPMYLALALLLFAWGLWLNVVLAGLLITLLFVALLTRLQIYPEERVLRAKFGLPYQHYCQRVRRWL